MVSVLLGGAIHPFWAPPAVPVVRVSSAPVGAGRVGHMSGTGRDGLRARAAPGCSSIHSAPLPGEHQALIDSWVGVPWHLVRTPARMAP